MKRPQTWVAIRVEQWNALLEAAENVRLGYAHNGRALIPIKHLDALSDALTPFRNEDGSIHKAVE